MRHLLIAMAALALTACNTMGRAADVGTVATNVVIHGPVVYADRTTADETAGRSVELVYKAARTFVETLVDVGLIRGQRAAQFQDLNRRAFAATQAVQAAYRSGNSSSIGKAVDEANAAIASLMAVAQKGPVL